MAVYLVTWDLNKEKPNYSKARADLLSRLEEYENIKDAGLDSVRFLSTTWSASQVSDDLRGKIDTNDRIIVVSMSGDHQGWLSKEVWDWINVRL